MGKTPVFSLKDKEMIALSGIAYIRCFQSCLPTSGGYLIKRVIVFKISGILPKIEQTLWD